MGLLLTVSTKTDNGFLSTSVCGFEEMKCVADEMFVSAKIEFDAQYEECDCYIRPKDIDVAMEWCRLNLTEGSLPRMLSILTAMKHDNSIYLYMNY